MTSNVCYGPASRKSGVGAGPGWIDAKFWAPGAAAGYESVARSLGNLSPSSALSTEAPMSSAGLAAYRYHVDLGGGGGTTWMGTLQKLAMPGLLFHHETVMRDFYFDDIRPMVHYVPVKSDLSDLHAQYKWAEENPSDAQKIARQGTKWAREFISDSGVRRWAARAVVVRPARCCPPRHRSTL